MDIDFKFYAETAGCYIIKGERGIVVAYRWSDNPNNIDLAGNNLHIAWLEGEMSWLLQFCVDGIETISFERKGQKRIRMYNFKRLKSKVLG